MLKDGKEMFEGKRTNAVKYTGVLYRFLDAITFLFPLFRPCHLVDRLSIELRAEERAEHRHVKDG
jgi:hypothetical protein